MEQEHIYDPLRFQYASNPRRFSLRFKVVAIVLTLIFLSIPLYEINEHTFQFNATIFNYTGTCFGNVPYWQLF
ncbi:hypothetical protein [Kordia sp.]|uniref:hypothetical protein n=1 Tax=Kordia sp. TaxID=1965332 RepID=UPI003D2E2CBF